MECVGIECYQDNTVGALGVVVGLLALSHPPARSTRDHMTNH
jgi:hypothetical protein